MLLLLIIVLMSQADEFCPEFLILFFVQPLKGIQFADGQILVSKSV